MKIRFTILYLTQWGERMCLVGSLPELGNWNPDHALEMNLLEPDYWEVEIEIPEAALEHFEYKYFLKNEEHAGGVWEWGDNRVFQLGKKDYDLVRVEDYWRPKKSVEHSLFNPLFSKVLMGREPAPLASTAKTENPTHSFQVYAPRVDKKHVLCIVGDDPALGGWDEKKALVMDDRAFPLWKVEVALNQTGTLAYKYGIYDPEQKTIVAWEGGENREIEWEEDPRPQLHVRTDVNFMHQGPLWKGAGVAVPIFALRSQQSAGVGEFQDIKLLVDWATKTGVKMIQILPINDTVATHKWMDSYPYAAISVFALHPIYISMQQLAAYYGKTLSAEYQARIKSVDDLEKVDYEAVMDMKSQYYKELYDEVKEDFFKDPGYLTFFEENKDWLVPYAAFSCLRDRYSTASFNTWDTHSTYDADAIAALCDPGGADYDDIAIHYFIQYHLDRQLKVAVTYAHEQGVILKGDIPIGIYRDSVDAWVAPHLYNMETQTGAPPDAFAQRGQNWGFPTYNWEEMAKDGYGWWRRRLQQMSRYFDAYRIDHILGFFRIWEIPFDAVEGLLGHFSPAMPFNIGELQRRGLAFNYDRFCKPYIRGHMLVGLFGEHTDWVVQTFLNEYHPGHYELLAEYRTQRGVSAFLDQQHGMSFEQKERIRTGLHSLIGEVLFLEAPFSNGEAFNPRIAMQHTRSFQELDGYTQYVLNRLYDDYFYHRHENFWRDEAMTKLPHIINAAPMMVCGEDLGMVPDCVPDVMDELEILSLEIQRMPKDPQLEFGHPSSAPYLSVVSTSTHDMSTIRGWWEEDRTLTQRFYESILGHQGAAPYFCEPWICKEIIIQHLYAKSMWAIFPIQDLMAMDGELRWDETQEEQINVPSNPQHYWRYRMHLGLEELLGMERFNKELRSMIDASGRNSTY